MEHEAPRQPEFTLESITLDGLPIVKLDIHYWIMLSEKQNIPDEISYRYLREAIDAAELVNEFLILLRTVEKPLRRRYRAGEIWTDDNSELADLEFEWLALILDGVLLDDTLRRTSFGKFFPKTRHRLTRKIRYVLSAEHERSLRRGKAKSPKP